MSEFFERYQALCKQLREECDRQVEDGELLEEMADFRYDMVKDEILWNMPE